MKAKVGDTIKWQYNGCWYVSEVSIVDEKEQYYGVYCLYGQDYIHESKCEVVSKAVKIIYDIRQKRKHWSNWKKFRMWIFIQKMKYIKPYTKSK